MYPSLLTSHPQAISETNASYQYFTERHLQAMWLEQKYFKQLKTLQDEPITVISPGIWNAEAGPDFLKAHLKIGSTEYFGDIEIHLTEESWYQHHHHVDERYDNVILHVCLWKPQTPILIQKHNRQNVLQAYFENCLSISPVRILKLIDLDLYPYKKFLGSGKCAHTLFRTLSEDKIKTFFSSAASWRLAKKHDFLSVSSEDNHSRFALGFARALGYKQNAEAFSEIYQCLNKTPLNSTQEYLALSMKACGYFLETHQKKWNASEYYLQLKEIAQNYSSNLPLVHLQLNQIRPLNHPIRRLFVLAHLLHTKAWNLMYDRLINLWDQHWKICQTKKDLRSLLKAFQETIFAIEDSHWNHHYSFETLPKKDLIPLMGNDLRNTILINVFLPILYSHIQSNGLNDEQQKFAQFYSTIPALKSGKTRYLTHRFFGDTDKGKILNNAQMEQGAYQLHHDFCLHYEASCEGCPFVDRFKLAFK